MTDYGDKKILAIDCASSNMKLGLQFGGDRLVKSSTEAKQSHSALIINKIQSLMESSACNIKEINAIVVCTGPGSFTGLRIGIACAKGMAVALGIPVVGVNLFEIASYKLSSVSAKVKVIVPFKRDEVFTGITENGKFEQNSIKAVLVKDLDKHVDGYEVAGVGFDVARFGQTLRQAQGDARASVAHDVTYDATELIYLGVEKLKSNDIPDISKLEPLYVQKSQAEIRFERNQS